MPEGVRPFQITSDEHYLFAQLSKLHGFVVVDLTRDSVVRTIALPTVGKTLPEATLEKSHYVMNHGLGISPDGKYLVANGSLIGITAMFCGFVLPQASAEGRERVWTRAVSAGSG